MCVLGAYKGDEAQGQTATWGAKDWETKSR